MAGEALGSAAGPSNTEAGPSSPGPSSSSSSNPPVTNEEEDVDQDEEYLQAPETTAEGMQLGHVDMSTSTLKKFTPAWIHWAWRHVMQNPANVLRGWEQSGLSAAWLASNQAKAHIAHNEGRLWVNLSDADADADGRDSFEQPFSAADVAEQDGLPKRVVINPDGSVNQETDVTYPVEGTVEGDPALTLEGMPESLFDRRNFVVDPMHSMTKKRKGKGGGKAAPKKQKTNKAAAAAAPLVIREAHELVGIHFDGGEEEDIDMRILFVGRVGNKEIAYALMQRDPRNKKPARNQLTLPTSFPTNAARMAWYKKHCYRYEMDELFELLERSANDPDVDGRSQEKVNELVAKYSTRGVASAMPVDSDDDEAAAVATGAAEEEDDEQEDDDDEEDEDDENNDEEEGKDNDDVSDIPVQRRGNSNNNNNVKINAGPGGSGNVTIAINSLGNVSLNLGGEKRIRRAPIRTNI